MMHLLIGLGPCPLGALRVCYQSGKNNDGSSYRVGSLSPRSPFGANEKGLKDEGIFQSFFVSPVPHLGFTPGMAEYTRLEFRVVT